jgi:hypothetical protein
MASRTFEGLLLLTPLAAGVIATTQPARAILTYNIYESGGNVVVQASGSLSLTGAISTTQQSCPVNGAIISQNAFICTGTTFSPSPSYPITGPFNFNGSAFKAGADSVSGIFTYLGGGFGRLWLDPTYTSGAQIFSSATYNGTTLAGLGFTTTGPIGTWTLNGTSETINVVVGPPTSVPGPLPLLGAGAAFGCSRRLRRRVNLGRVAPNHADSISA